MELLNLAVIQVGIWLKLKAEIQIRGCSDVPFLWTNIHSNRQQYSRLQYCIDRWSGFDIHFVQRAAAPCFVEEYYVERIVNPVVQVTLFTVWCNTPEILQHNSNSIEEI